ncbi:plasmid mobilization relaxosome protein MobC [uncultured Roseibium sp.]|uniref:plasmid mobilization protein n=1 Tax=uncultured Roseibium sp. TaxID=1936171 RepID=UPI00260B7269|nr:plasmid mobilization relaxosome protein MobC [uncultured Roseibium sp.]
MARPKHNEHEARSESTRADLTLAEKEQLRDLVRASGLRSEAEFVRHAIFNQPIRSPARSSSVDPALITELNRIGVNVNQLAAATHMGRDFSKFWQEVGTELRGILTKVVASGS